MNDRLFSKFSPVTPNTEVGTYCGFLKFGVPQPVISVCFDVYNIKNQ